ncbi:hypothetical protein GcC1_217027 [Golovinomyces cichoracearum]|uniref:Uncharacterized protein n=1 Tax=Golovinomyces cichoracearum TaxID=62708 RepID=A0A420H8P9_9PEZI|nr:hypothetical protein GcC1_217027 [Golovinomyces cichoracearum]
MTRGAQVVKNKLNVLSIKLRTTNPKYGAKSTVVPNKQVSKIRAFTAENYRYRSSFTRKLDRLPHNSVRRRIRGMVLPIEEM